MVKGDIRRKVEDTKPKTYEDIALKCLDMSARDSCLVALLYLSGRRIGEILHLQKQDFTITEDRVSFWTFNLKVFRRKPVGNYSIPIEGDFIAKDPKTKEITPYTTRYYERINPHWKTTSEAGKSLSSFVLERVGSLIKKEDYLFQKERGKEPEPFGYGWAYQIIRYHFPDMWPHLLRHERFTEVFRIYKDDLMSAHEFTFHKRFESNKPYIRPLEIEKERV